ncbi:MAG TPA: PCP reductase family protein [Acidobacteriota bacterium]|nr:PCP reductase family protein [Acidobacteriota bacterium]
MSCDEQMSLVKTVPPEEGAGISVLYGCPECGNRIGMLTNPWETQLVSSLGVKIGGKTAEEIEAGAEGEDRMAGCPFSGMVQDMGESQRLQVQKEVAQATKESLTAGDAGASHSGARTSDGGAPGHRPSGSEEAVPGPGTRAGQGDPPPLWTETARQRLANIPEFVRPMAKQGIEHFAMTNGYPQIDEKVLDEAKDVFGM